MQAFCRIGISMYVILFVDNRYGMLFNRRRLSRAGASRGTGD